MTPKTIVSIYPPTTACENAACLSLHGVPLNCSIFAVWVIAVLSTLAERSRASICENFKCLVHSTLVIFIFMILLVLYGMYKSRGWELRSERWKMGPNGMGSGFSWHWLQVSSTDSWVASTVSLHHKLISQPLTDEYLRLSLIFS